MPSNRPPKDANQKTLREWLRTATPSDIGDWADIGLRHKSGIALHERLEKFLERSRLFGGYATPDGSWGEFEKHFSVMVLRIVRAEQELEKLKAHPMLSLPVEGRCVWCGEDNLTEAGMYLCEQEGCQKRKGDFIEVPEGS